MRLRHLYWIIPFLPFVSHAASAETTVLRVGGSGGSLCLMSALTTAYARTHNDTRFVLLPSVGSSGGIKAVTSGALEIGLASRPLKGSERAEGAVAHVYGRTPFVFAVHTSNPTSGLTLSQLADIYLGKTRYWADSSRLRLIMRPDKDSDTETLRRISPELNEGAAAALAREGMIIANTDRDSADAISTTPGAIGTSTLGQISCENRPLKGLAIDGVTPSVNTLASGRYRYEKPLYVVISKSAPQAVRDFVNFLHSPASHSVLAQMAVIPVGGD